MSFSNSGLIGQLWRWVEKKTRRLSAAPQHRVTSSSQAVEKYQSAGVDNPWEIVAVPVSYIIDVDAGVPPSPIFEHDDGWWSSLFPQQVRALAFAASVAFSSAVPNALHAGIGTTDEWVPFVPLIVDEPVLTTRQVERWTAPVYNVPDETVPQTIVATDDPLPPTNVWPRKNVGLPPCEDHVWTPTPASTSAITVTLLSQGTDDIGGVANIDLGIFDIVAGRVYIIAVDVTQVDVSGGLEDTPTSGGPGIQWLPGFGDEQIFCTYSPRNGTQTRALYVWVGAARETSTAIEPIVSFIDVFTSARWQVLEVIGAAIIGNESEFPLGVPGSLYQWSTSTAQDQEPRPPATLLPFESPRNALIGIFSAKDFVPLGMREHPPSSLLALTSGSDDDRLLTSWFPGEVGRPTVTQAVLPATAELGLIWSNTAAIGLEVRAGLKGDEDPWLPSQPWPQTFNAAPLYHGDEVVSAVTTIVDEDAPAVLGPQLVRWTAPIANEPDELPRVTFDEAYLPGTPVQVVRWTAPVSLDTDELSFIYVDDQPLPDTPRQRERWTAPVISDTDEIVAQPGVFFLEDERYVADVRWPIILPPQPVLEDGDRVVFVPTLDEDPWVADIRWPIIPPSQPVTDDVVWVAAPVTIVDEDGWVGSVQWRVVVVPQQIHDSGEWVTPPAFGLDDDALVVVRTWPTTYVGLVLGIDPGDRVTPVTVLGIGYWHDTRSRLLPSVLVVTLAPFTAEVRVVRTTHSLTIRLD